MTRPSTPLSARFARHFTPGGPDECWRWQGAHSPGGHGQIREGGRGSRVREAHRVAFELAYWPVPSGRWVYHSCRTPDCVNPAHLRCGTPEALNRRIRRNPSRGEACPSAKLTAEAVLEIRRAYAAGARAIDLATRHGVTRWAIYCALNGRTWAHVGEVPVMRSRGRRAA